MKNKSALVYCATLLAGAQLLVSAAWAAEYEQNLEKSFTVSPGGKLVIQADRGPIKVDTDASDKVEVRVFRKVKGGSREQADALFKEHEVTFSQDGGTVSVIAKDKKARTGVWSSGRVNLEVSYQVNIPRKFDVELKTAGGDIQVGDLDGRAVARTTSGAIKLQTVSGDIVADDAGGDISITDAGRGVMAHTTSGSIVLQKVQGKADVSDAGGDIRIVQAGSDVMARTTSGTILLSTVNGNVDAGNAGGDIKADTVGGDVTAHTTSGSIHLGVVKGSKVKAKDAGGNIEIGEAAGSAFAETTSGSINIRAAQEVDARDAGGNINIGKADGKVFAQTTSGSIHIKAVSGTVQAKNAGGNISIDEAAAEVDARTTSGSIVFGTTKGSVTTRDSGGDIKVGQALAPITAETTSGTISVNFGAAPKADCRLEVAGGGIQVALPRTAAIDLDARANGGSVVPDMPVTVTVQGTQKPGVLQGKINGGGPTLMLRASSGDIHLHPTAAAKMAAEAEN